MSDLTITTNNVPRDVIHGFDLSEAEAKEFDYLASIEEASFFRYKGQLYDLGEFVRIAKRSELNNGFAHTVDNDSPLLAWHGIQTDTYFSGTVVKYCGSDWDSVVVGRVSS